MVDVDVDAEHGSLQTPNNNNQIERCLDRDHRWMMIATTTNASTANIQ